MMTHLTCNKLLTYCGHACNARRAHGCPEWWPFPPLTGSICLARANEDVASLMRWDSFKSPSVEVIDAGKGRPGHGGGGARLGPDPRRWLHTSEQRVCSGSQLCDSEGLKTSLFISGDVSACCVYYSHLISSRTSLFTYFHIQSSHYWLIIYCSLKRHMTTLWYGQLHSFATSERDKWSPNPTCWVQDGGPFISLKLLTQRIYQ